MKRVYKIGLGIGIALAAYSCAIAADLPVNPLVKVPVPNLASYDWNGWYIGGRVGVIRGASNWSAVPLVPAHRVCLDRSTFPSTSTSSAGPAATWPGFRVATTMSFRLA